MASNKKFNLRHYWMSTNMKSVKKCTACGCIKRSVYIGNGIYQTNFELNGVTYEVVAPDCKHIDQL